MVLRALPLACAAMTLAASHSARASQALPTVNITSVSVDSNSVKVDFTPVPGAQDYRIFDISNPYDVKYAGIWHLDADTLSWPWSNQMFAVDNQGNPIYPLHVITSPSGKWSQYHHIDVPATEIEFNGLVPGQATTLVVEAVDAVGPVSYMTLADQNNNRIFPLDADCNPSIGECALGGNMGCTWWADQLGINMMSTNGQGDFHNNPNVIARSQPFVVTASGVGPIPDTNSATQTFCDTFASGSFTAPTGQNLINGLEFYNMTTPAGIWDIQTNMADIRDSSTFVHKGHVMDVLFDGSTPGSNDPLHVAHGVLTFSPEQTVDLSNGQILHVTMEVDTHTDNRRWVGINLAPANDPLQNWYPATGASLNNSDTALFLYFLGANATVDEYVGRNSSGVLQDIAVTGPAGAAIHNGYRRLVNGQYGHGLDNRSRIDLFISTTHFAVYEDGVDIEEYDLPQPLPFSQAKVYYTAYMYHSALEQQELQQYRPYETYWINQYPFSDERHWDNMGFEVLPAGTAWSSMQSLITMPQATAPIFTNATVPIVNNGNGNGGNGNGGNGNGGNSNGNGGGSGNGGGNGGNDNGGNGGSTTGGSTTGGSTTGGTTTGGSTTSGSTTGGSTTGGSTTGGVAGGSTTGATTGGSSTSGTTSGSTSGNTTGGSIISGTTGGPTTDGTTTGGTTSGSTTGGGSSVGTTTGGATTGGSSTDGSTTDGSTTGGPTAGGTGGSVTGGSTTGGTTSGTTTGGVTTGGSTTGGTTTGGVTTGGATTGGTTGDTDGGTTGSGSPTTGGTDGSTTGDTTGGSTDGATTGSTTGGDPGSNVGGTTTGGSTSGGSTGSPGGSNSGNGSGNGHGNKGGSKAPPFPFQHKGNGNPWSGWGGRGN
ncbi:MAG TPA: hypothetical protein VFW40_05550 [Capsulimonadaceae bacterium]|nr:hypothetical protein [Capsulimonadaceae bacterium]